MRLEDHEGLRPWMIVCEGEMNCYNVSGRRQFHHSCSGAAGKRKRRCAAGRIDNADVLHENAALEAGANRLGKCLLRGESLGIGACLRMRSPCGFGVFNLGKAALSEAIAPAVKRSGNAFDIAQV